MIGSFWRRVVEDDFDDRSFGEEQSMINLMSTEKKITDTSFWC